jgi:tetratricopeptide (TPR) repeat protein
MALPGRILQNRPVNMDDHDRQQLLLGREHFDRGEYDKAEYLLRQVVSKADRFADVHHMLGIIAHSGGDFAEAARYFEKAVEINPNYTEAQLNLMVTYNELGRYDEARRLHSTVLERSRPQAIDPYVKGKIANMHAQVAQAYVDAGMQHEALAELSKAVSLCPDFADLRLRLGLLHRDVGAILQARAEFEAARNANPKYVAARLALGTLLLSAGELEAARREFEAVLQLSPGHKAANMYLRLIQAPAANTRSSMAARPADEARAADANELER